MGCTMAAIVSQLNSWFGGVLRYLQLAQAQTPLTASSALGWVCTTFAGGMSFTSLSLFSVFSDLPAALLCVATEIARFLAACLQLLVLLPFHDQRR